MNLKHLYYGNGKGKTTAALGLALRAAGNGMNVHIVQFLKGTKTGELNSLSLIENISVSRCDRNYGFTFRMTENDKKKITDCHNKLLADALERVRCGKTDMLILDEIIDAFNLRLIDREMVLSVFLDNTPSAEIVMTGHKPTQFFIDCADYASEIRAVKHPFEKGIKSRKGIEF